MRELIYKLGKITKNYKKKCFFTPLWHCPKVPNFNKARTSAISSNLAKTASKSLYLFAWILLTDRHTATHRKYNPSMISWSCKKNTGLIQVLLFYTSTKFRSVVKHLFCNQHHVHYYFCRNRLYISDYYCIIYYCIVVWLYKFKLFQVTNNVNILQRTNLNSLCFLVSQCNNVMLSLILSKILLFYQSVTVIIVNLFSFDFEYTLNTNWHLFS